MQRTKCLHVCLHIDWNPYGTFKVYIVLPRQLSLYTSLICDICIVISHLHNKMYCLTLHIQNLKCCFCLFGEFFSRQLSIYISIMSGFCWSMS